jgi:hypothetical protein
VLNSLSSYHEDVWGSGGIHIYLHGELVPKHLCHPIICLWLPDFLKLSYAIMMFSRFGHLLLYSVE